MEKNSVSHSQKLAQKSAQKNAQKSKKSAQKLTPTLQKYLFFALIAVLFVGFLLGTGYVLKDDNDYANLQSAAASTLDEVDEPQSPVAQDVGEANWAQKLLKKPLPDYTPAAERFSLSFEVDKAPLAPKNRYFQLFISKHDVYSLFCLKQTLNASKVRYNLTRTQDSTEIFLETDEQKLVENIVQSLKKHDINARFEEVWL